jgi:hypothetical protein
MEGGIISPKTKNQDINKERFQKGNHRSHHQTSIGNLHQVPEPQDHQNHQNHQKIIEINNKINNDNNTGKHHRTLSLRVNENINNLKILKISLITTHNISKT